MVEFQSGNRKPNFTKLSLEAYLLKGEPKLESANKQKWISYEMLLEMMEQIGVYYQKAGQNDKDFKEYEKALKLVEVFREDKAWLNEYQDYFSQAINMLKSNRLDVKPAKKG